MARVGDISAKGVILFKEWNNIHSIHVLVRSFTYVMQVHITSICCTTIISAIDFMQYVTKPNLKWNKVDRNLDTMPPFWVARKTVVKVYIVKHFARSQHQWHMQVSLSTLVSFRSCRDLVHSGWKCKITFCTGEKGACKLLCNTYAPKTTVIFATQNGGVVSGFLSTIRFMFSSMR